MGNIVHFVMEQFNGTDYDVLYPVNGSSNPNMLDNWYFLNPVNQRNKSGTISSQGYFIDRWVLYSGTVTIESDGITVNGIIYQLTEKYVSGAKATVLTDTGIIDAVYTQNGERGQLIIETHSPIKIKAVKLELGSQQTLAHQENGVWVLNEIPDYGEQLRRCQRYYFSGLINVVTQASGLAIVQFPVTMRKTPAVTVSEGAVARVSPDNMVVRGLDGDAQYSVIVSASTSDL